MNSAPHTQTDLRGLVAARLISGAIYFIAMWVPIEANGADRRPNIVVIMADDLGYECLEVNGSDSYKTPRLDRLAAEGMRFENCHSQPLCTPSRVQLMTGKYNQRNYVRFGLLDSDERTFAQVLRHAGYATCIVGKWQLAGGFSAPDHFGFDEYCLWQLTRRPGRYPNPGLEINGREVDFSQGEYGPDIVSNYVCDFIERNRDRPFLAYYPMILPHWPFEPTPDGNDWDPTAVGRRGKGDAKYFADMVSYTDKMVGKVIDKLSELGLREETLVLFTGDNGTATQVTSRFQGREIQGGKGKTIDAGTHVPLIASWPGTIKLGKVSTALVDFTDFFPTLADVANIESSADWQLDGQSFAHILRGSAGPERRSIYGWYARDGGPTGTEWARDRRYKLYGNGRFYDVTVDPLEKIALTEQDLSRDVAAIYQDLQATLDRYDETRDAARFAAPASARTED